MRPQSIAEIAERTTDLTGAFDRAVREFVDFWQLGDPQGHAAALADEPKALDRLHDAYLAALAEHLALSDRIAVPQWTEQPHRFLSEPFFAGGLESLKATLLVESPLAFRRRLIFISADGLSRPHHREIV
jgi:hypothetical protein